MKRLLISLSIASLATLGTVAVATAAGPAATSTPTPVVTPAPVVNGPATGTIAGILGMTQAEIMTQRMAGKTLVQIAATKGIGEQVLVDALVAQWGTRIDARVAAGALTADQATALRANLVVQAKAMVNQATLGGMRGGAVGAGPGAAGGMGGMRGQGMGNRAGMGRNGAGMGTGTGTCPMAPAAPQS